MQIVIIEWVDAFIDTDDFDVSEAAGTKPVYRSTVGFLVAKNQYGYILATDKYRENKESFAAKMFISHGMIVSVKEIK